MRNIKSYGLTLLLVAGWAHAQTYPTKTIRVHTAGVGGSTTTVARIVAPKLSEALGQPVVIENQPPVTLVPGIAKAAPDGYTLMVTGGNLWIGPLFAEATYDPVRDIAPIATLTRSPTILVVNPSVQARSVAELIKLAKTKPGELNYTSGVNGSASHLAAELFKSMAGTDIVRVIYKSQEQENADLMSGRVQMTFGGTAAMGPLIKSGKLRGLATTFGSGRSLLFPELPSAAEALPGFSSELLLGLFAPGKTPEVIIRRLNQEAARALDLPDVRDLLLKSGFEPVGGTPDQLAAAIKTDMARVGKLIKDVGIKSGE